MLDDRLRLHRTRLRWQLREANRLLRPGCGYPVEPDFRRYLETLIIEIEAELDQPELKRRRSTCAHCGVALAAEGRGLLYCSTRCRWRAQARRRRTEAAG